VADDYVWITPTENDFVMARGWRLHALGEDLAGLQRVDNGVNPKPAAA
jgi:hypothetical protein